MLFCCPLIFFSKSSFFEDSYRNTIRLSNSLDPDQAGLDLGMFKNNEAFHFMASYAHKCLDFKEQT